MMRDAREFYKSKKQDDNAPFLEKFRWSQRLFGFCLCLLTCLLPFDHRYDKWARKFSLKLIPDQLELPVWFEKRLYVYPSDLIAIVLFAIALYSFRIPLRKLLLERGGAWLWSFFFLCLASIATSSLVSYPVSYTRLLQLFTPIVLFLVVAQKGREWAPWIHRCLCIGGVFQAIIALYQYFFQEPMGLHFLGELKNLQYAGEIPAPEGVRWLIDHWTRTFVEKDHLFRASGTFHHSNPLGAFLLTSLFSSFAIFCEWKKKRWLIAGAIVLLISGLIVTYSRSALIGAGLGGSLFFYKARPPKSLVWVVAAVFALCALLFGEQLLLRGGIVSTSEMSTASDQLRLAQNKVALSMIAKHPLFGVGYRQFTTTPEFNSFEAKEAITMVHNTLLLIAAESGLFALFCTVGFFVYVFRRGAAAQMDAEGFAALAVALAFCWIGLCDFYPFYFQGAKMVLFLMMGLSMAASCAIPKRGFVALRNYTGVT